MGDLTCTILDVHEDDMGYVGYYNRREVRWSGTCWYFVDTRNIVPDCDIIYRVC